MAATKPKQIEIAEHSDLDDFEVGSDDEGEHAKITVPVTRIQTRGVKDEQAGKSIPTGNLLELGEDGILSATFINIRDPRNPG